MKILIIDDTNEAEVRALIERLQVQKRISELPQEIALICHEADDDLDDALRAAFAIDAPSMATDAFMYMPAGAHEINPSQNGKTVCVQVHVGPEAATALNEQLGAINAKAGSRKKVYFDFDHKDGAASFWPTRFEWRALPEPGVYAIGEWTASGKAALEGKDYRGFSPVFHVNDVKAKPARIACRANAKPNMGGLVNNPAFAAIKPLFARDAHSESPDAVGEHHRKNTMKTTTIETDPAALQGKVDDLTNELTALKAKEASAKAKQENTELVAAEIRAKESEVKAAEADKKLAALEAKQATLEASDLKRRQEHAKQFSAAMVARGALAAKDTKAIEDVEKNIVENAATFEPIYAKWAGHQALTSRITTGKVEVTKESSNAVMKEYGAIIARNAAIPLRYETHREKGKLALEAAALFAKEIESDLTLSGMSVEDAIAAADFSDAAGAAGLLSGTLVLQRALPLLQYDYPLLGSVTSDFSDAPGLLNQTETTRIILKPAVQTRSTAVDSAGRPLGWNTVSPAQSVDVSVTLDEHVGIPIVFGQNTLAQTVRNLFAEAAPMALYALGQYAVNKLTALMTAAKFNAYKQITDASCGTTSGSTAITLATTAGVYVGQEISGTGIPSGTHIASVTDGTHAVMTIAATATATVTATLGGGRVPTLYATYIKALADFNMASLSDIKAAFDINEVPMQGRFALLASTYFQRLTQDPTFNTFWAAVNKPDVITAGMLPNLQGFNPMNAPWFPSSSNRVGFAGHKAALIFKSRLPTDITSAVGAAAPGSVTTVTMPGGISVALVQYVSLREGYAEWRPEVMLGAAVGDPRAGMVITSQ